MVPQDYLHGAEKVMVLESSGTFKIYDRSGFNPFSDSSELDNFDHDTGLSLDGSTARVLRLDDPAAQVILAAKAAYTKAVLTAITG